MINIYAMVSRDNKTNQEEKPKKTLRSFVERFRDSLNPMQDSLNSIKIKKIIGDAKKMESLKDESSNYSDIGYNIKINKNP